MSPHISRALLTVLTALSAVELSLVLFGATQPPQPDETTPARLFQLGLVLFTATFLVYLATADWRQPLIHARRLAVPLGLVAVALALLLYLESVYWTPALSLAASG
jgi:hypothetical protein